MHELYPVFLTTTKNSQRNWVTTTARGATIWVVCTAYHPELTHNQARVVHQQTKETARDQDFRDPLDLYYTVAHPDVGTVLPSAAVHIASRACGQQLGTRDSDIYRA